MIAMTMTAMISSRRAAAWLVASCFVGACTGPNLPTLPLLPPASETAAPAAPPSASGPIETSVVVSGTPTGVFTQVARAVHSCWLAADGPLKATYVYRAEAEPPAKGGAAEILLHEKDISMRDLRGVRAYRISFASEAAGVRVVATALKFEPALAQAMARDVETWAKGGNGCQLRALFPPPPPPVAAKPAKGAGPGSKKR